MSDQLHPLAPHHLPPFIAAPGETDVWMVVMGVFLIVAVLAVGNFYLRLHTLPERMAHKSQKLQFEVVAVLGLLALFTHVHLFWIAGLLLALDRSSGFQHAVAQHRGFGGEDRRRSARHCRSRDRTKPKAASARRGAGKAGDAHVETRGARPCLSCCSVPC